MYWYFLPYGEERVLPSTVCHSRLMTRRITGVLCLLQPHETASRYYRRDATQTRVTGNTCTLWYKGMCRGPMFTLTSLRCVWITLAALFVVLTAVHSAQAAVVSEQCDGETRILNNNTALQDSAPILQCNIDFDVATNCTVDYNSVSKNYSNACAEAGGQFYTTDIFLDCSVNLGGQNYKGTSDYRNTPLCLGIRCTGSEIEMEFEANLYPNLKSYYAARGVQCEVSRSYNIPIPTILQNMLLLLVVAAITFGLV